MISRVESGHSREVKRDACPLCRLSATEPRLLFAHDRPILTSAGFVVSAALGQFCSGYVLLLSKAHVPTLGALGIRYRREFLELKEEIRDLLKQEYGISPVFFEHGPGSSDERGGSCIDHAHLHALPIELDSPPHAARAPLAGGRVSSYDAVTDKALRHEPYFYFESSAGHMFLFDAEDLPCQYGRRLMAEFLGTPNEWNWRVFPYYQRMVETIERLSARSGRPSRCASECFSLNR
jgi:hypothetical protein